MRTCDLHDIIEEIEATYKSSEAIFFTDQNRRMPSRNVVISILKDMRNIMFPGYFSNGAQATPDAQYFVGNTILRVEHDLVEQVREALLFRDGEKMTFEQIDERAREVSSALLCKIPSIQQMLYKDIQAAFDGDPAAQSKEEIISLAARQQKFIQGLKAALTRIENKTYGIDRITGKLIPKERLKAVPHATLSVESKMAGKKN